MLLLSENRHLSDVSSSGSQHLVLEGTVRTVIHVNKADQSSARSVNTPEIFYTLKIKFTAPIHRTLVNLDLTHVC